MEQKITDQELYKVFAMYIDAPVMYRCKDEDVVCRIVNVGINSLYATGTCKDGNAFNSYGINGGKLLITPLEDISEAHKNEISKIVKFEIISFSSNKLVAKVTVTKYPFNQELDIECLPYDAVDKLREWGYMLPYKNINLFEAGIAIKKPSTP